MMRHYAIFLPGFLHISSLGPQSASACIHAWCTWAWSCSGAVPGRNWCVSPKKSELARTRHPTATTQLPLTRAHAGHASPGQTSVESAWNAWSGLCSPGGRDAAMLHCSMAPLVHVVEVASEPENKDGSNQSELGEHETQQQFCFPRATIPANTWPALRLCIPDNWSARPPVIPSNRPLICQEAGKASFVKRSAPQDHTTRRVHILYGGLNGERTPSENGSSNHEIRAPDAAQCV